MKLKLIFAALLSAVVLASDLGQAAPSTAACCVNSTSRLESLLNPSLGSDEKFFAQPPGPPNVLFLMDTSANLGAWPREWPVARGCDAATHVGFVDGYDPTVQYEGLWKGLNQEHGEWFNRAKFYPAPGGTAPVAGGPYGLDFRAAGKPSGTIYASAADACNGIAGISAADSAACQLCLAGGAGFPARGYYVYDATTRRVSGNFLNFYAPKNAGLVMVLSQIVRDVRTVRLGIGSVDKWPGNGKCWDTADDCVCMWEAFGPNCGKSFPLDQSSVASQRNSILNNLTVNATASFGKCSAPLASLLYAGGHLYRSLTPDSFSRLFGAFPTSGVFDEPKASGQLSICGACGFNAMVFLTDGAPGVEKFALPTPITDTPVATCVGPLCASGLDEMARYLWTNDLRDDYAGNQRVSTYTVGFATNADQSALLQSTAKVGGGLFFHAQNTQQLRQAIYSALDDIVSRNISFSSAAVANIQTAEGGLQAILPRLYPRKNLPWIGQLWRFEQYNEFVMDVDYNSNGNKDDILIIDADGTPIVEDQDGNFIKPNNSPAVPYWEAGNELRALGHAARKVWTVLDTSGDGSLTEADQLVELTTANLGQLINYLGAIGTNNCPRLGVADGLIIDRLGMSTASMAALLGMPAITQGDLDNLCAAVIIQYARGQDLADEDGDGSRTDTRDSVLGDIFHSSPVVVDPPVDHFLCDLGLHNQCVRTLYSQFLGTTATPVKKYAETNCASDPKERDAYDSYVYANRKRDKLVLVGANDGMVHAFHNGDATETCDAGNALVDYDRGTGREQWAFVPTDLLPRLFEQVLGHTYYVDGDIMVRDVWADSNNDGEKDKDEYHTLAVVAEGRGGSHYFALEVRYDNAKQNALDRPGFRWMFPQPCTETAPLFGKTFFSLSPKPPPIGPVLIDQTTISGAPTPVKRYGVDTLERWVVMLSGGFSPALEKGRGVYMVDAWSGIVNGRQDNLWWKLEFDPDAASNQSGPSKGLTHGVAAPIAMVDYGGNSDPRQDGFFDTITFGDTAGQLWVGRMFEPGKLNNTSKLIENWSGARAFEMDRDNVSGGVKSVRNVWPFYYLPSVGIQPGTGAMRAVIGTGNRYALLEENAGTCRFDNPLACAKYQCDETSFNYRVSRYTTQLTDVQSYWKGDVFAEADQEKHAVALSACGAPGLLVATGEYTDSRVNNCPMETGPDVNPGDLNRVRVQCGQSASGYFSCNRTDVNIRKLDDLGVVPSTTTLDGLGKNRFYSVWVYGGDEARKFDEAETSAGYYSALEFDGRRLTDRTSASPTEGDLVNVTSTSCDTSANCTGPMATNADWGWVYDYDALSHKTVSGGAIIASCALWSTIFPQPTVTGVCAAGGKNQGRLYQGDFVTGAPNCAAGFRNGLVYDRYRQRDVVAPPPEPAATIQISKTGQIKYSAMIVEQGKGSATQADVTGGQDVLQSVYELPVSRALHECRHGGGNCVTVPP